MDDVGIIFGCYAGARLPDRLGWKRSSTIALSANIVGAAVLASWASGPALWLAIAPSPSASR